MTNANKITGAPAAADNHQFMKREYSSDKTRCGAAFLLLREAARTPRMSR